MESSSLNIKFAIPGDVTRPPAESTKAKHLYMCDVIVERNNNYAMFL
jgi:hypothetical protein